MKIQKLITLDIDIGEKLKLEPNASGLINRLLWEHFDREEGKNLSIPELEHKIEVTKLQAQIEELEDEFTRRH